MIDEFIFQSNPNRDEHLIATYLVKSRDLTKATKDIAIGQSVGNPDVRTKRDSPEIFRYHLAKIVNLEEISSSEAKVEIAYPLVNFDIYEDGITQSLCTLMGGQMDIDTIESCRLTDVYFPKIFLEVYKGPKFGMENIKERTGAIERPLLGGIIKPKTGITVSQLEEMVKEMLAGGVDFIKEDEILGNPPVCPFKERVKRVSNIVNDFAAKQGREIFYAPCINSDYPHFLERAQFASENGAKALHLNFWAGLSAYRALRDLDLDSAIFFQRSGIQTITSNKNIFAIGWNVISKLIRMMGCDFAHAGMWAGYHDDTQKDLSEVMQILREGSTYKPTVPSLSCGSHPGLVDTTVRNFGTDLMMNVGGKMQGHPLGTEAGARAMRQAMDKPLNENMYSYMRDKPELKAAIEAWGYVDPENGKLLYKKE
jgi:ribulose-bisphosphate carboxylase large chain